MDEPSPTRYLVIDTETSGLFDFKKPADHESQPRLAAVTMISVGADLTVEDERTLYIKPDGWEMKPDATRINGLTTEMLEDRGVPVAEALDIYALEIRRGSVVVAFNAQFDTKMLRGEMRRAGIDDLFEKTPNICVMRALAGRVPGKKGWPKLKDACAHFRIDLKSAHTSVGDARAALEILRILVKEGTCPPAEVHYAKNRPQDGTTGD